MRELEEARADVLLLCCTELSLLDRHVTAHVPVLDSLTVLAHAIVACAKGETALPERRAHVTDPQ